MACLRAMESISFTNTLLLLGAFLVCAGILSSLLAFRFGAPLLLVFLAIGMLVGEDGPGGVPFDDYRLTYLIGSGALAVILFDGGLRTRLGAFRGAFGPAAMLATFGVVVTAALSGAVAVYVLELTWLQGLLVGAIIASTDAAAVFFLLRTGGLQLRRRVGATLEVESGINDPVAVFLTVTLVEILLAGQAASSWHVMGALVREAVLGTLIGLAGGFAMARLLNRVELSEGLHPLFVVSGAVGIFGAAAVLKGSGFLAVYLAGLVLGNSRVRARGSITSFHDALTWLCQIVMFIVLGLLVTPSKIVPYIVPALVISAGLMIIARPVAAWLSLLPFRFRPREIAFVSWVGLRGAVSIFLSAIPVLAGLPQAEMYFNVAFFVVLISLLVQGWTIVPAAVHLGVALPRQAMPIHRVELDLPGQFEFEMVGYPVFAGSPVLRRGPLPRWARPALVIRNQAILQPAEAGPLRAGDYAYFLAPPERAAALDHLFRAGADGEPKAPIGFPFAGDTPVAKLSDAYGLAIPEPLRSLALAELFAREFEDGAQEGDRVPLGDDAVLVVLATEDDHVTHAALLLDEAAPLTAPAVPGFVKRIWRRLGPRPKG
jgi:cell volume regulation protein A